MIELVLLNGKHNQFPKSSYDSARGNVSEFLLLGQSWQERASLLGETAIQGVQDEAP